MPEIRCLKLYCLCIFSDSGTPRVFSYSNTDELLEAFCEYKDSSLFPYTFTKDIYVTEGHPLFGVASPILCTHGNIHLKK